MKQIENAKWPKACLQVYTGNGKGKTTAAFGLALRAAGRGLPVFIGQFMKQHPYGEFQSSKLLQSVTVEQFGSPELICQRDSGPSTEDRELAAAGLARISQILDGGAHRIVILDEVNVAVHLGLIEASALYEVLDQRPTDVECICTGRYAPEGLIERADLVTEMKLIKHPYQDQQLAARDGIER